MGATNVQAQGRTGFTATDLDLPVSLGGKVELRKTALLARPLQRFLYINFNFT